MDREQFKLEFAGLHIYSPYSWHDPAYICGTRKGIEQLRDALNQALTDANGAVESETVFVNDGEGFSASVHVLPYSEFNRLAPPYTGESAKALEGSFWPHHLPMKAKRTAPPLPRATEPSVDG